MKAVGARLPRYDGLGHVTGRTQYVDDVRVGKTLWVKALRSPHHHAKITKLDTSKAAQCSWTFFNGWPCKWEISELDASKSEISIETLEIAHDGLEFNFENGQKKQ